ncbi:hypothetical protein pqer_cds_679 [Pandoravirus quercus]|uniref:Uncharacterized protein n=1 Tax=Pandoravirus quercus TaxID=2107709 RepID=A0A2U7U9I1_9VIRU|nr:hypothetical protein pqer_cds_679 [Pandoravirus quercus]AVK75101.1 hypothetical protein pqer_cds_679 [Pandoravirus quercus]
MKGHTRALLRRGAGVAGYGEITSVSASVKAHTPHGYLARLDFAIVYEFRGPEASEDAYEEDTKDNADALAAALDAHSNRPHRRAASDDDIEDCDHAHTVPPPIHTWWPRHSHLCIMLSLLYNANGVHFLRGLDDLNTARAAVPGSAPHVADDLYEHVRRPVKMISLLDSTRAHVGNAMGGWGALPAVVFARARLIADSCENERWCDDSPNYYWRLPRFPWLASRQRPWSIGGLPDRGDSDAIGDFHTLAGHRDDALWSAFIKGFYPYSYDGIRIMFQCLRRAEEYASSEAVISGLKDMRRQLYASPHRT